MKRQIVVTNYKKGRLTALYEDDKLQELYLNDMTDEIVMGDIYIGKVKHIVPNISAAFVEVRPDVMGYYSLKENTKHHFANYKKNDKVVAGDEIVVQIDKENLKTKAYTLTGELSISGRYVVLFPDREDIRISAKITDPETRNRLTSVVFENRSDYGWMIRTESAYADEKEILAEMEQLAGRFTQLSATFTKRTCHTKLYSGDTQCLKMIKRYSGHSFLQVTTDIPEVYEQIREAVIAADTDMNMKLSLYNDDYPLIKLKGIEAQIEKALDRRVWLKSGANLLIEPTEALTVIDVNTGKAIGKQDMEAHFYKINQEAAVEAMRQLRIRNISGIVIIDFINMKENEHKKELMKLLRAEASKDSVSTTIVDMTALHLVEITRKKSYKSFAEQYRAIV